MEDEEDFDGKEFIGTIKNIYKRLSVKDLLIILLILMMFAIYVVHSNNIIACNAYYQGVINNITKIGTSGITPLW